MRDPQSQRRKKALASRIAGVLPLWDLLRTLRERKGLTQAQCARLLEVTPAHIWGIEQPYRVSNRVPSVELLRKCVDHLAASKEERPMLLMQLLIARARLFEPPEIVQALEMPASLPLVAVPASGMPTAFVERVTVDLACLPSPEQTTALKAIGLDIWPQESVWLSPLEVARLAQGLKQPRDRYLMLAGYLPASLSGLLSRPEVTALLERLQAYPAQELPALLAALVPLIDLHHPPRRPRPTTPDQPTPRKGRLPKNRAF